MEGVTVPSGNRSALWSRPRSDFGHNEIGARENSSDYFTLDECRAVLKWPFISGERP